MPDLSWKAYVAERSERLPRGGGETWADVPRAERRRVTRNFRRWKARRMKWLDSQRGQPLHFRVEDGTLFVKTYEGWRHA